MVSTWNVVVLVTIEFFRKGHPLCMIFAGEYIRNIRQCEDCSLLIVSPPPFVLLPALANLTTCEKELWYGCILLNP